MLAVDVVPEVVLVSQGLLAHLVRRKIDSVHSSQIEGRSTHVSDDTQQRVRSAVLKHGPLLPTDHRLRPHTEELLKVVL